MGIGGGVFFLAIGAILKYAVKTKVGWIDLKAVGVVLMLAGATILVLTLWFWRERRRRGERTVVEDSRLTHFGGGVPPDPPSSETGKPPNMP